MNPFDFRQHDVNRQGPTAFNQQIERQQIQVQDFLQRSNPNTIQYSDDFWHDFLQDQENPQEATYKLYNATYIANQLDEDVSNVFRDYDFYAERYYGKLQAPETQWSNLKSAWQAGEVGTRLNRLYFQLRDDPDNVSIQNQINRVMEEMPEGTGQDFGRILGILPHVWVEKALQSVPEMVQSWKGGAQQAAVAAAGALPAAMTASAVPFAGWAAGASILGMAMQAGFAVGSYSKMQESLTGASYREMREAGIDHDIAHWTSGVAGSLAAGVEQLNVFDFLPVQQIGVARVANEALQNAFKKIIGDGTWRKVASNVVSNYAADVATNVAEEILQEVTAVTMRNIAAEVQNSDLSRQEVDSIDWEEARERLHATLVDSFQASVVLGAPRAGFNFAQSSLSAAQRSIMTNKRQQQMNDAIPNVDTQVIARLIEQDTEGMQSRQTSPDTRSVFADDQGNMQTFYIAERNQDGMITAYPSMEQAVGRAEISQIGLSKYDAISKINKDQPGWLTQIITAATMEERRVDLPTLLKLHEESIQNSQFNNYMIENLVSAYQKIDRVVEIDTLTNAEIDALSAVGIDVTTPNFVSTHIDTQNAIEITNAQELQDSNAQVGILPDGKVLVKDPNVLYPVGIQEIKRSRIPKQNGQIITQQDEGRFIAIDPETNKPAASLEYNVDAEAIHITHLPDNPTMAAELVSSFIVKNPGKFIDLDVAPADLSLILNQNPEKQKALREIDKLYRVLDAAKLQADTIQQQQSQLNELQILISQEMDKGILAEQAGQEFDMARMNELQSQVSVLQNTDLETQMGVILDEVTQYEQQIRKIENQLAEIDARYLGLETAPQFMEPQEIAQRITAKVKDGKLTQVQFRESLKTVFPQETDQSIDALMVLGQLRAEKLGMEFDTWLGESMVDLVIADQQDGLDTTRDGAFMMLQDARSLIALSESATPGVFVHEFAHVLAHQLTDTEMGQLENWFGKKYSDWSYELNGEHEQFARSFEAYILEGKMNAPAELKGVFETLKYYMARLYTGIRDLFVSPDDTLYSIFDEVLGIDEGRNFDPDGTNIVPAELQSDFPLFHQVMEEKNLVAVHNLSDRKLSWAMDMHGIPMLSFMISKIDSPSDSFGDISLILPQYLADPKQNKKTKLFAADAYTPRTPSPTFDLKSWKNADTVLSKLISDIKTQDLLDAGLQSYQIDGLQQRILSDLEGSNAIYSDRLATIYAIKELGTKEFDVNQVKNSEQFVEWALNLQTELYDKKIFDGFTNSGKRRYLEYNLENLFRMMKKEGVAGGENFFYGVGSIRALVADKLKSLSDAKKKQGLLADHAQVEAFKELTNSQLDAIVSDIDKYYRNDSSYSSTQDIFMSNLFEGIKNKNWEKELSDYGFSLSETKIQQIKEFLTLLSEGPTEYFEGKILDVTYLNAFPAAIVPNGISQELIAKMESWGIKPYTYEKGNQQSKTDAYLRAAQDFQGDNEILFHTAPPKNSPQFKQWFGDSKVVDENGDPLVLKHSTDKEFDSFNEQFGGTYLTDDSTISSVIFDDQRINGRTLEVYAKMEKPFDARWKNMDEFQKSELREIIYSVIDQEDIEDAAARMDVSLDQADPFELFTDGEFYLGYGRDSQNRVIEAIKQRGYDGVIFPDSLVWGEANNSYVVFSPTQIKSVNNQGTWNSNDSRMLYHTAPPKNSQAFKSWFGQSKVVNENGDPLQVFQGRTEEIDTMINPTFGGSWFTTALPTAEQFAGKMEQYSLNDVTEIYPQGGRIYPVYLSINNPLVVDISQTLWDRNREIEFINQAKENGHDGLVITHGTHKKDFVAFEQTQIKSVYNNGQWSKDDPRLLYHTAYHGSPHLFDRFSTQHMGTGEGAQAFGWGLYFTENEMIASDYARTLAKPFQYNKQKIENRLDDKVIGKDAMQEILYRLEYRIAGDQVKDLKADLTKSLEEYRALYKANLETGMSHKDDLTWINSAVQIFESLLEQEATGEFTLNAKNRNLYTVEIPDANYIEWDKPYTQQEAETIADTIINNPQYRESIQSDIDFQKQKRPDYPVTMDDYRDTIISKLQERGEKLYKHLSRELGGDRYASLFLHENGFSGIKYPAQYRSGGDGSKGFNYVVFDDNQIKVEQHIAFHNDPVEIRKQQIREAIERGENVPLETLQEFSDEQWAADEIAFQRRESIDFWDTTDVDTEISDAAQEIARVDTEQMDVDLRHEYEMMDPELFYDRNIHDYISEVRELDPKRLPKRDDLNTIIAEKYINESGMQELRKHARKLKAHDHNLSGLGFGGKMWTYIYAADPQQSHLTHAMNEARNNINDFRTAVHTMLEMAGSEEDGQARYIDQLVDKFDPLTEQDREFQRRVTKSEDDRRKRMGIADLYDEIQTKVRILRGDVKNSEIQKTYQDVTKGLKESKKRYEVAQQQLKDLDAKLQQNYRDTRELEQNIVNYKKKHNSENKELTRKLRDMTAAKDKFKQRVKDVRAKEREAQAAIKENYRELNKAQKMVEYQKSLVRQIQRLGKRKNVDFEYKQMLQTITDQFDFTIMGPRQRTELAKQRDVVLKWMDANQEFMNKEWYQELSTIYAQDFSVLELENVKNAMKVIIEKGREVYEQKRMEKARILEERKVDVQESLIEQIRLRDKAQGTPQEIADAITDKAKGAIKPSPTRGMFYESITPQYLFDRMDGGKDFAGSFMNQFYTRSKDVINERQKQVQARTDVAKQVLADFGITELELTLKIGQIGEVEITLQEGIGIYTKLQNERSTNALLFGNQYTMQEMQGIITQLTPQQRALGDWIIEKGYGEHYDRLRQKFIELENVDLGREENYTPIMRRSSTGLELDAQIREDLLGSQALRPAKAADGFTKARVKVPRDWQTPIRLDEWSMLMEMIQKQEHYIAATEAIKDMQSIINPKERIITELISDLHGPEAIKTIDKWIQRFANPNSLRTFDYTGNAISRLRKNTATAYLAYNTLTPLKQLPSALYYLGDSDVPTLTANIGKLFTSERNEMEQRMYKYAPLLKDRMIESYLSEIKNMNEKGWEKIQKAITQPGMYLIRQMDKFAVTAGWNAVFEYQMAQGKTDLQAAQEATNVTLRTQPTGDASDMSAIFSNEKYSLFTQFGSQLNQIWSMNSHLKPSQKAHIMRKYAAKMAAVMMGGVLLTGLTWKRPPEDQEELIQFMADVALSQTVGSIPIAGGMITNALSGFDYDLPISAPITAPGNIAMEGIKQIQEQELDIEKLAVKGWEGLAIFTGIPYTQTKRVVDSIIDATDEQPQTPDEWRAMVWQVIAGRPKRRK